MKNLIALSLAFTGTLLCHAEERTWTNTEGVKIEAELLEVKDDGHIKIKASKNNRVYDLELSKLSKEDQDYVSQQKTILEQKEKEAKVSNRKAKWTDDFEEAKTESKESGLPILLFFTGSDWCGYCMKLDENVFDKKEFKEFCNSNLVLMKADFPHNVRQSKAVKEQNTRLKSTYPISGYPCVYIVDSEGKTLGKLGGYGGDDVESYIKKIQAYLK